MNINEHEEITKLVGRLNGLKASVAETEGADLTDAAFARRFLPFSATTWSKLNSNTYEGGADKIGEKLRAAVETVEAQLPAIAAAAKTQHGFVRTTLAKATFGAVNRARAARDGRRVVAMLAPTGGGKTAIATYLRTKGAVVVEGRQSWRNSYRAFCLDVARAVGRKIPDTLPECRAEAEMLAALSTRDGLLVIDEANTMCAACANGIKLIVNATGYSVVILAIPQMWDKFLLWNRDEVMQVVNRCQAVIRSAAISHDDVAAFARARGDALAALAPAEQKQAVALIRDAANDFGGYRTIITVLDALAETGKPSLDDVRNECRRHHDAVAASGIGRN